MSDIEYNPIGWAKDSILTGEIAKILDSTEAPIIYIQYQFRDMAIIRRRCRKIIIPEIKS